MTTKVNSEKLATMIAKKENLYYGFSVFGGNFFIGDIEQLKKIGCINIK